MRLARFNKWTQYLKRDILLETLECNRALLEDPKEQRHGHMYVIVRNPNFDLERYSKAFPSIQWSKWMAEDPPSAEEFDALVDFHDPPEGKNRYDTRRNLEAKYDLRSIFDRATEQQLRSVWFSIVWSHANRFGAGDMAKFVGRPDIPIDIVADVLCSMVDSYGCEGMLMAMANRSDMTLDVAKKIYDLTQGSSDGINVRLALISNPALSINGLYETFGAIPDIVLNQSFEPHHLKEPRFAALANSLTLEALIGHNCNFKSAGCRSHIMNPRFTDIDLKFGEDWGFNESNALRMYNKYTQHPHWRVKCQARENALYAWLREVWGCLTSVLPDVLVETVLDVWYTPVI